MSDNAKRHAVDLTKDLKELVGFATKEQGEQDLLRRGLDWLSWVAPYDLAAVFTLEGEFLRLRLARGPIADQRTANHALAHFPTIRESIEARRARVFTENDHKHGDGDPFDEVIGFPPGHSCMVVPLCATEECLGVLMLDRSVCEPYPPHVVSLVEVYGQLLAVALQNARQKGVLGRLHEQRRQYAHLLETERVADPSMIFERSRSVALREVIRRAQAVAETNTPILILGETGNGTKPLLQRKVMLRPRTREKCSLASLPDTHFRDPPTEDIHIRIRHSNRRADATLQVAECLWPYQFASPGRYAHAPTAEKNHAYRAARVRCVDDPAIAGGRR